MGKGVHCTGIELEGEDGGDGPSNGTTTIGESRGASRNIRHKVPVYWGGRKERELVSGSGEDEIVLTKSAQSIVRH